MKRSDKRRIEYAIVRQKSGFLALPYSRIKDTAMVVFSGFYSNGKKALLEFHTRRGVK